MPLQMLAVTTSKPPGMPNSDNAFDNMKGDVQNTVNSLITSMMNIDPRDFLSDAEIDHHLEVAFNKFDKDNSGELDVTNLFSFAAVS